VLDYGTGTMRNALFMANQGFKVIALGWPKETVVITDVGSTDEICYYHDSEAVHFVPKRRLDDIIFSDEISTKVSDLYGVKGIQI
jgi:hypothetical protein